jgi:hypothetical protein
LLHNKSDINVVDPNESDIVPIAIGHIGKCYVPNITHSKMCLTTIVFQATVTMMNYQMYRHIMSPGWTLRWVWAKKEVIWSMVGAETTQQGDCSKFKGNIPYCCEKNPTIVDLLPGVPYNQQVANCCKGGVVASWGQDPSAAVSAFQLTVGSAGTSSKTVRKPMNFTLLGPGQGYTCSQANTVPPSIFLSSDGRRQTQALSKFGNDIFVRSVNIVAHRGVYIPPNVQNL